MSTRSPACNCARSNKPCQAVKASIGTDAASTWVSRAGLGAIAAGGAQQNSAVAPCAYQSFVPNPSWPTMPSAPTPTAAMAPENSWPGMAWRRFSPDLVCVVGCHNNSVPVTPTAWTRIKTSPRWGPGVLTSACTSPGTGRESSHCQAFILHLVVKGDFCSGTGRLLAHPRLGVLLQLAGVAHLPPLVPFRRGKCRSHQILLEQVFDAQALPRVDERDGLGAVNDVLAGEAGDVRAGAADHRPLDDDGLLSLARQGPGDDLAGHPAADDQVLNVLGTHDDAPFRRERLMPRPARSRATPRRATRARSRAGPGP